MGKLGHMPQFSSVEKVLPHWKSYCKNCHKNCYRRLPHISLSLFSLFPFSPPTLILETHRIQISSLRRSPVVSLTSSLSHLRPDLRLTARRPRDFMIFTLPPPSWFRRFQGDSGSELKRVSKSEEWMERSFADRRRFRVKGPRRREPRLEEISDL